MVGPVVVVVAARSSGGLSRPGWGGVERGAGPAYRGGGATGESAGVVFDFSVGGGGDHGECVAAPVVGNGRNLFAGGVDVPQQGGTRDGANRGARQARGCAGPWWRTGRLVVLGCRGRGCAVRIPRRGSHSRLGCRHWSGC